jgi:hypothetical protein
VKHADGEIPKEKSAIFSYTAEAVVSLVASPWIKLDVDNPTLMALTSSDEGTFFGAPDTD